MKKILFLASLALNFSIVLGQTTISFNEHSIDENFTGASVICVKDVNNDGLKDLVIGSESTSATSLSIGIWWLRNNGDNSWTKFEVDENFNNVMSIELVDINNDGNVDILASGWSAHEIAYWLNSGDAIPTWIKRSVKTDYYYAHDAHAAYLNKDSLVDIVGLSAYYGTVNIWYQQANGTFTEQEVDNTLAGDRGLSIADYDNDGNLDIAVVAASVKQLAIFYASSSNPIVWTKQIVTSDIDGAHEVVSLDFDNDGDIDLLTSAYSASSIDIWENNGENPVSWTRVNVGTHTGVNRALAADFDNDGDFDIVATGKFPTSKLSVWENEGNNSKKFTETVINNQLEAFWALAIDDFDNDGDIDFFSGASVSGVVRWWENTYTPTGIFGNQNNENKLFKLYPNPAINQITLDFELKTPEKIEFTVYNIVGAKVDVLISEESISGFYTRNVSVSHLNPGTYICKLSIGDEQYSEKLIITK